MKNEFFFLLGLTISVKVTLNIYRSKNRSFMKFMITEA